MKLAADILAGIARERNAGVTALLGAIVHQTVFADVEIAAAGPALPVLAFPIAMLSWNL